MTEVVDLDSRDEPPPSNRISSSPEVQFLRATVRSPEPPPGSMRGNGGVAAYLPPLPRFGGLTEAGFGHRLVNYFARGRNNLEPAAATAGDHALMQELRLRPDSFPQPPHRRGGFWFGEPPGPNLDDAHNGQEIDLPPLELALDYEAQGFTLTNTARVVPEYKPPSPAPKGFTRTAGEDEIVICPNCNEELGVGEDPLKRQIWISKPCGHVSINVAST